jgi:hypothetical protein
MINEMYQIIDTDYGILSPNGDFNFDQNVFGRFPIYLWITNFECSDL